MFSKSGSSKISSNQSSETKQVQSNVQNNEQTKAKVVSLSTNEILAEIRKKLQQKQEAESKNNPATEIIQKQRAEIIKYPEGSIVGTQTNQQQSTQLNLGKQEDKEDDANFEDDIEQVIDEESEEDVDVVDEDIEEYDLEDDSEYEEYHEDDGANEDRQHLKPNYNPQEVESKSTSSAYLNTATKPSYQTQNNTAYQAQTNSPNAEKDALAKVYKTFAKQDEFNNTKNNDLLSNTNKILHTQKQNTTIGEESNKALNNDSYIDEIKRLSIMNENSLAAIENAIKNVIAEIEEEPVKREIPESIKTDYSEFSESKKFRSGYTMEDLAIETMLPYVKKWIDENLERISTNIIKDELRLAFNKKSDNKF